MKFLRAGDAAGLMALLVFGLGACDLLGPEERGGPGTFTVTLLSPHGEEGAAVFQLTGGEGLGTVSAVGGEVFYRRSSTATTVVVVMDDPGEVRFRIRTDELRERPEVSVLQVSDAANQLRPSVSGYTVEVEEERDLSRHGGGGSP